MERFLGFVSDDGRVVGIGRRNTEGDFLKGVTLAVLQNPLPITTWLDILAVSEGPEDAVCTLLSRVPGAPHIEAVDLDHVTQVFRPAGSVGEA